MKVSKNGQYALVCIVDLAVHSCGSHVSVSSIANRQNIDHRIISQIFFILKKSGLLIGIRGKAGGYSLSKDAAQITAGDVVRMIEGSLAPTDCSLMSEKKIKCDTSDTCFTRTLWQRMAREIDAVLDSITIADIAEKYQKEVSL